MNTDNHTLTVNCPNCGASLSLHNGVGHWRQQVNTCVMPYCNVCHHMWPLSEEIKEDLRKTLEAKTALEAKI